MALLLYQNENYISRGRVLDREENYVQTLARVQSSSVKESHMPVETFPLQLVHSSDDMRCYLCHPKLRDRPVSGKCAKCISEAACGRGVSFAASETAAPTTGGTESLPPACRRFVPGLRLVSEYEGVLLVLCDFLLHLLRVEKLMTLHTAWVRPGYDRFRL